MDYNSFCNKLSNIYSNNLFYYKNIWRTGGNKVCFFSSYFWIDNLGVLNNLFGINIITSIIGGALWIFVLKIIYRMKWLKTLLIAFIIWVITNLIGFLIPTLSGPL